MDTYSERQTKKDTVLVETMLYLLSKYYYMAMLLAKDEAEVCCVIVLVR